MKKLFALFAGLGVLLAAGCQTAAEKEIERLTLPQDHPLPRLVVSGTPDQVASTLRKEQLSADSRSEYGVPLLVLAAAKGDVKMTKLLLEKGAKTESSDKKGCRALHAAASCGHREIVSLLLKHGADLNAPGTYGRTPLMEAARTSRKEITQDLLAGKILLDQRDMGGRTALMHACTAPADDTTVPKMLLAQGADPKLVDKEGRTALMHAALNGNTECAMLFLKNAADFTGKRKPLGLLILKCAIDGNNPGLVKELIRKKVPLNWNWTFAHSSLRRVKLHGLYRILVRQGVLDKRRSPLMWAALKNNMEIIQILLKSGADPLQEDENGNTAYDLATDRRVISFLKKAEKNAFKKLQEKRGKQIFRSKMFQ